MSDIFTIYDSLDSNVDNFSFPDIPPKRQTSLEMLPNWKKISEEGKPSTFFESFYNQNRLSGNKEKKSSQDLGLQSSFFKNMEKIDNIRIFNEALDKDKKEDSSNNKKDSDKKTSYKGKKVTFSNSQLENIKTAYSFFINTCKLTKEQAAGFIGNLFAESRLNPGIVNESEKKAGLSGYGRGIAQWSDSRIEKFRATMGKYPEEATLEEQLEYVWIEAQQRPALMKALSRAKTVEEATDIVLRGYENGGRNTLASPEQLTKIYVNNKHNGYTYEQMLDKRLMYAVNAYNYLQGTAKMQEGGKFWKYILDGFKTMSDPQTMGTSYMNSPAANQEQAQEAGKLAFDATTAGDIYNLSKAIYNKDNPSIASYALALALPAGVDGVVKSAKAIKQAKNVTKAIEQTTGTSTSNLIPEGEIPAVLRSMLPERSKTGTYSTEDINKIKKAKQQERIQLIYDKPPLNFFYKEGVDFIKRTPTEEEIQVMVERNFPRIANFRKPDEFEFVKKEALDELRSLNVLEYSDDMMNDYNEINKGPRARAFSYNDYPTIAVLKNGKTKALDMQHEMRHQLQSNYDRTDEENKLFQKAFGDFKGFDDYDVDVEFETMTTDARNALMDWFKEKSGGRWNNGTPIDFSDIKTQNILIDRLDDKNFIDILYDSDGYWGRYLNQIKEKFGGVIPADKLKAFKEVITKTGMLAAPITIGATQLNKNKEQ